MKNIYIILLLSLAVCISSSAQTALYKGDAQIEVGNFYTGLEFHHTCPMIQRVSFYYPSANSLDQSTDYWKRDSSYVMAAGLKSGTDITWFNHERFDVEYYPYKAIFSKKFTGYDVAVKYEFLNSEPAFAITYTITNRAAKREFEFYTDIEASLRTSHTYKLIAEADTEKHENIDFITYRNKETQGVSLFCINKGEQPVSYSFASTLDSIPVGNVNWWKSFSFAPFNDSVTSHGKAFRYIYKKDLAEGESLTIVQVIGSVRIEEAREKADKVAQNYTDEIKAFEEYVLNSSAQNTFTTGDQWLDNTIRRSKEILAVNRHYIDGSIQPMPCPAEYNFYFTHDVLLTDLAAVNFDLERVKNDLSFVASHSRADSVIPHAYYWKDSAFVTEYADPDNWNHFWFIIASSKYLLHSGDTAFLSKLYPIINKSVTSALSSRKDDLMYAKRPDWWDIGNNYGPRAYMTILAIKSLNEFIYISKVLNRQTSELQEYSNLALQMKAALNEKLWDKDQKYLINIMDDGKVDHHYFIGSLLANHFNMIDIKKKKELIHTASEKLLDKQLGIFNAFPMDFHKLISYYKFLGDEAGAEAYYANGGIWPHGNAWYALALASAGEKENAFDFVKNIMTVDGMLISPNGQPAMYEVRMPDYKDKSKYGKIDKPQFMWAAGWYLYTLYNLFGTKEEDWNITLDPWLPKNSTGVKFVLNIKDKLAQVSIDGKGGEVSNIKYNGKEFYSLVVPEDLGDIDSISVAMGQPGHPFIKSADCQISGVTYNNSTKILEFSTSSFKGKEVTTEVISPAAPVKVSLNGKNIHFQAGKTTTGFSTVIKLKQANLDKLIFQF